MDDWVLESDHYKFYDKANDFRINVEKESVLSFPEHLHVYTFERENYTRFPNPKKGSTGVSGLYYFFQFFQILIIVNIYIFFRIFYELLYKYKYKWCNLYFSDYYLFDGGSILPVLALDIQFNDMVLDMCAAPGGKALTIFQTLMPRVLVANDVGQSRINRLKNVMNEYVSNICEGQKLLIITQQDARSIDENGRYNKVSVFIQCFLLFNVLWEKQQFV